MQFIATRIIFDFRLFLISYAALLHSNGTFFSIS